MDNRNNFGTEYSIQKKKREIKEGPEISNRGYDKPPSNIKMSVTTTLQILTPEEKKNAIIKEHQRRLKIAKKAGKVNNLGYGPKKKWMSKPAHMHKAPRLNSNNFAILHEQMERAERREKAKLIMEKAKVGIGLHKDESDMLERFKHDQPDNLAMFGDLLGSLLQPSINRSRSSNLIY